MSNRLLALVDCQNDFIDGGLAVGYDKWVKAYSNIEKLILENNFKFKIFTYDWHPLEHCSYKENGGIWPFHCVADTYGADLYWKLKHFINNNNDVIIKKGMDKDKEEYGVNLLKNINETIDEIDLCGIAYDYCVSETAKMTADANINTKIIIHKNACCSIDESAIIDFSKYSNIEVR